MLEVDLEFKKGFLFIRLKGELTKKTLKDMKKEVTELIQDNKIRNVVFNVNCLEKIDSKGMRALYENYRFCQTIDGNVFLLTKYSKVSKKIQNNILSHFMKQLPNETSAFAYI